MGAGIGRVRMRTIPNASGDSLMAFVGESIEPGSVVHTDGWLGYEPLEGDGYRHEVSYLEGQPARAGTAPPGALRGVVSEALDTGARIKERSATSISTTTSTNSPSASTAASRSRGKLSTAWFSRPSPWNRRPTNRWSEAPRHALRPTTQVVAISSYLSQVNTHHVEKALQLFHRSLAEDTRVRSRLARVSARPIGASNEYRKEPLDAQQALQNASAGVRFGDGLPETHVALVMVHLEPAA